MLWPVIVVKFLLISKIFCDEIIDDDDKEDDEKIVNYNGYQVWEFNITPKEMKTLNKLEEQNEISILGSSNAGVNILVSPDSLNKTDGILKGLNITHDVTIQNLQKVIDEEMPIGKMARSTYPPQAMGNLTWNTYYNLESIHSFMDYLAKTHPNLCTISTIGRTIENRPIKLLKISNKNPLNRAIIIDGGIHAREWISPATVTYIINEFVWNFHLQPKFVQNIDWYFIPILNPDGYKYTWTNNRMWRKNRNRNNGKQCIGVDLNRNFGFNWGPQGTSTNPCSDIYKGEKPFSERESIALRDLILNTKTNWWGYISFHSYGQYILIPYAVTHELPKDYNDLESLSKEMVSNIKHLDKTQYTTGNTANIFYIAAGGSDDWAKGSANIKYSYTIELMDTGRYGFILPAQFIQKCGRQGLEAVKVLAKRVYMS